MIEIVTEEKLISKYQKEFIKQLKTVCTKKVFCNVGFQGGSIATTVFYSSKFDFWFTAKANENRYWNAFGVGEPIEDRNVSIHVEINFPYESVNRNIGGAFGHNNKGEVLLLHRGKIGGGRIGVGKQLFFDNFRGDFATANDDGIDTEFLVIGSIHSKHFPKQVSNFIAEVHRIKNITTEETNDFSYLENFNYTDEHSGTSRTKRRTITIERTHGIVVNSLASILKDNGLEIGNDRNRDLFIHKRGQIKTLFEIKTSSSTQALYSAVGQLLIYSIPIKTALDLFLVLPDKVTKPVEKRLTELGLKIIYYAWDNNEPTFENLDEIV
jgi:hypothetical protein